jgi:hypothetical protein
VQKKAFESAARVKLLNKKGELIPEAGAIFQAWFRHFSDQEGYITPKDCSGLIKATNIKYRKGGARQRTARTPRKVKIARMRLSGGPKGRRRARRGWPVTAVQ